MNLYESLRQLSLASSRRKRRELRETRFRALNPGTGSAPVLGRSDSQTCRQLLDVERLLVFGHCSARGWAHFRGSWQDRREQAMDSNAPLSSSLPTRSSRGESSETTLRTL